MKSPRGVYQLTFYADGAGTLASLNNTTNGSRLWSYGNGDNVPEAVNAYLTFNGIITIYSQSPLATPLGMFGNVGASGPGIAYTLIVQDTGQLVVYPVINGVFDPNPLWASG